LFAHWDSLVNLLLFTLPLSLLLLFQLRRLLAAASSVLLLCSCSFLPACSQELPSFLQPCAGAMTPAVTPAAVPAGLGSSPSGCCYCWCPYEAAAAVLVPNDDSTSVAKSDLYCSQPSASRWKYALWGR
jgi:hypothetical protein